MRKQVKKTGLLLLVTGMVFGGFQSVSAEESVEEETTYESVEEQASDAPVETEIPETEETSSQESSEGEQEGETTDEEESSEETDEEEDEEPELLSITDCDITISKPLFSYNGQAREPSVTVSASVPNGETGMTETITLAQGTDYTVSYEDNVNYGVGRAIIQGIGKYTGYYIAKFGIMPKQVKNVKVSSPFYMENTVTWKKAKGADGYYIYRKAAGGDFEYICNITDENYEVFHDTVGLQEGQKYSYHVVAYVEDSHAEERVRVREGIYSPSSQEEEEDGDYQDVFYDEWYDEEENTDDTGKYESVKNPTSYYSKNQTPYETPYNYSCVKGRCTVAFEAEWFGAASGKVSKTITNKRYFSYTGNAAADYMVYLTNQKIIKNSMGDESRVKAIYDWMVKNTTFTKDVKDYTLLEQMKQYYKYDKKAFQQKAEAYEEKLQKQIYQGKALCIGTDFFNFDRGLVALSYRQGSCSYLTPMFNMLCQAAGVEAHGIDGDYVNKDKSKDYHNWSFVRLGKTYYWYDVAVAVKNKSAKSVWYKKGTSFWKTCHAWAKKATKKYHTASFAK